MGPNDTSANDSYQMPIRPLSEVRFPRDEAEASAARKAIFLYTLECEPKARGWAGELLNTDEVCGRFEISAGQLNAWRRAGQIICFGRSRRKRLYPAEQFTDDRGVAPGIDGVLEIVGEPGAAWLWLRCRCGSLDGRRPLDLLKAREL